MHSRGSLGRLHGSLGAARPPMLFLTRIPGEHGCSTPPTMTRGKNGRTMVLGCVLETYTHQ